jgi:hypothetical protein
MIPDDQINSFTLPCLPNLASRDIVFLAPWGGGSDNNQHHRHATKTARRKWQSDVATRHTFYSVYEADNPTLRLSKENHPRLLLAIGVDYDCYSLTDDVVAGVLDAVDMAVGPAFVSRSNSRGIHALWLLEEPVWCVSPDLRKRLLNWFKSHLRLGQLFPGMDEKVFHDAMIYFDSGQDWQVCERSRVISTKTIARAMQECGERANFKTSGVAVPLDVVAAEVEAKYPGVWNGEFVENARGPRFWESGADAMSAIVKPEGMLCYTGDRGFVDWSTIFGRGFIEQYLDNKVGGAADSAWFDGRDFWIYAEATASWRVARTDEMARKIKVEFGLSGTLSKGEVASEVDRAINQICSTNLVAGAAPFVQRRPGILYIDGKRHLNTANVAACAPIEGDASPDDFPWIENFLEWAFVKTTEISGHDPQEQLLRFLAWLKRAYLSGLNYAPTQGHVVVLAGMPGSGKTLLANALVGGALGGKKDASAFLLGETTFNKALYEIPLWVVNDANAASDPHRKARFNSLVKKVAANREFEHHAKFRDATDVSWMGRLIITCNVDPESIQVMPQLDSSMADKVLAFRMWGGEGTVDSDRAKGFNDGSELTQDQKIIRELPYFLRWLIDTWSEPDWIKRDSRFGIEPYHYGELKEQADAVSASANFEEAVEEYLGEYFRLNASAEEWRGNATKLGEAMKADGSPVQKTAASFSAGLIGRHLANLVNKDKVARKIICGKTTYVFNWEKWADSTQTELNLNIRTQN